MQIPPVKELAMVSRPARAQVRLEVSREEPSSSVPKMVRGETKSGMRASMEEILPFKPTTMDGSRPVMELRFPLRELRRQVRD